MSGLTSRMTTMLGWSSDVRIEPLVGYDPGILTEVLPYIWEVKDGLDPELLQDLRVANSGQL